MVINHDLSRIEVTSRRINFFREATFSFLIADGRAPRKTREEEAGVVLRGEKRGNGTRGKGGKRNRAPDSPKGLYTCGDDPLRALVPRILIRHEILLHSLPVYEEKTYR